MYAVGNDVYIKEEGLTVIEACSHLSLVKSTLEWFTGSRQRHPCESVKGVVAGSWYKGVWLVHPTGRCLIYSTENANL